MAVDYPQSEHGRVGQLDEEKHEEVLNYINMYRDLLEVIKTEFDAPRRLFEGEVQDMKSVTKLKDEQRQDEQEVQECPGVSRDRDQEGGELQSN